MVARINTRRSPAVLRRCLGLLPLLLLPMCHLQPLHLRSYPRFCQGRSGNSSTEVEACFGLRLSIRLAEGGLFNQHLQLLSFLSLGIASGCSELLVEHSPRRKHSVSVPGYIREPLDSLWDMDQLRTYLEGHGIALLVGRDEAHPPVHTLASFHTLLEHYEDIGDAASAMRKHVLVELTAMPSLPDLPGKQAPKMVEVLISNIFRGLQTGHSHLYRDVALHTQMAPHLRSLAQTCIERMGQRNASFVGIHLRIEGDFERMERTGGRQSMLAHYSEALKQHGVAHNEQLYIASGIFITEPAFVESYLQTWSSHITHRALLLSTEETSSLDVMQLAAIDFLVVCKAAKFVGWQGSSFSFWIPEERALHGLSRSSSIVIEGATDMGDEHNAFARSNSIAESEAPEYRA